MPEAGSRWHEKNVSFCGVREENIDGTSQYWPVNEIRQFNLEKGKSYVLAGYAGEAEIVILEITSGSYRQFFAYKLVSDETMPAEATNAQNNNANTSNAADILTILLMLTNIRI